MWLKYQGSQHSYLERLEMVNLNWAFNSLFSKLSHIKQDSRKTTKVMKVKKSGKDNNTSPCSKWFLRKFLTGIIPLLAICSPGINETQLTEAENTNLTDRSKIVIKCLIVFKLKILLDLNMQKATGAGKSIFILMAEI